jgi:hypothetical protein
MHKNSRVNLFFLILSLVIIPLSPSVALSKYPTKIILTKVT